MFNQNCQADISEAKAKTTNQQGRQETPNGALHAKDFHNFCINT